MQLGGNTHKKNQRNGQTRIGEWCSSHPSAYFSNLTTPRRGQSGYSQTDCWTRQYPNYSNLSKVGWGTPSQGDEQNLSLALTTGQMVGSWHLMAPSRTMLSKYKTIKWLETEYRQCFQMVGATGFEPVTSAV